MKNKKILMYICIIILILTVIGLGYLIYINISFNENEVIDEYVPESEITDEQLRETIVNLYFINVETGELMPESRQIDVKELMENPYSSLVNLLIQGPLNEKLVKVIPDEVCLNKAEEKNGVVIIDFSEEFIKNQMLGKEQEELIINSIVNTLTELTEVSEIKILINGEENKAFPDGEVTFDKTFSRQ